MAAKKTAPKKTAAKKVVAKKAAAKKVSPAKPAKKTAAKKTSPTKAPAGGKANPKTAKSKIAPKSPVPNKPAVAAPAKKMSSFVAKQHRRLLDLRDELVDAMTGVTGEIRKGPEGSEASGSGMHQGDAGSDAYDRDFALSVLAKEQDALYEIEQALKRIERGSYGICELSGNKIPHERLEAIPFARLTVECQAQWEKEYGKLRFRPKAEIGFSNGMMADEDSESVLLDETEE